jgi:hypothetical protein
MAIIFALALIAGAVWLFRRALAERRKLAAMTPEQREAYRAARRARQAELQAKMREQADGLRELQASLPQKSVSKSRKNTHHGAHLLGTIMTGGLWAPAWASKSAWHTVGPRKKTVTRY